MATAAKRTPLDDLRVATPCEAPWEGMEGDDRVRFCGGCRLNVYNLSALPREEAERLVREREGRLCVRFFRRPDGTLLSEDCPVGLAAVRRRLARIGAALAASLAVAVGLGAVASARNPSPARTGRVQRVLRDLLPSWILPAPSPPPILGVRCPPIMGEPVPAPVPGPIQGDVAGPERVVMGEMVAERPEGGLPE